MIGVAAAPSSGVFRWGILGAGHIAGKWARDLAHVPDARLQAVWARDPEKARTFQVEHGATRLASSIADLLGKGDLDAVYVASPHGLHRDHVLACLEAGIPVLCEKAFTLDACQALDLANAARSRGVFLMEALWTRFLPGFEAALRLARSGSMGKPLTVEADFGFAAPYAPHRRLWNPAMGGGSLLDIGLYPLFFAIAFLGRIRSFQARLELAPNGVDHTFHGALLHEGGGRSSCLSTFQSPTPCQARIVLEGGEIRFPWMFHTPVDVEVLRGEDREFLPGKVSGNGYQFETIHAQDCIRQGGTESPLHPLSETLALMELLDSIRREAART
ncbi:MAG TPA: Gfo/Idh/MocA family oxidoreductase [Fibrobacteria bacterium]|nr:Gfo/Idh/MocA family oxidoreductase [Fibrobacteria bacterium]HOX50729.1 Gfo/Idh/MocA family oxidoreductase [Fibrobacteria bacterium]